jgi:hypothetical protein
MMIDDGKKIDRTEEASNPPQSESNVGMPWIFAGRRAGKSRVSEIIAHALAEEEASTR